MVLKECLLLTLLVIFLYFFGYPSWKKYSDGRIVTSKKHFKTDKIESPAITICPGTPMEWKGKRRATNFQSFLDIQCNDANSKAAPNNTAMLEQKLLKI